MTRVEVAIPAGRKVVGFTFHEIGLTNAPNDQSIIIELVGAEIKEFGSTGVLFIEVISVDLESVLI